MKSRKKPLLIVAVVLVTVGVGGGFWKARSKPAVAASHAKADPAKADSAKAEVAQNEQVEAQAEPVAAAPEPVREVERRGFYIAFRDRWRSFWTKINELEESEAQNARLRLENANLRNQLEAKTFALQAEEAKRLTDAFGRRIEAETGSPVGRLLSSINYQPPTHLLPRQLYALGVSYFKARENEKAAVIFTQLIESSSNDEFKTPRNYLLAAVSWYRLDHFEAADTYLARALEMDGAKQHEESTENDSNSNETLAVYAQIRLWRALTAKRLGDERNAQRWLTQLMDHHPGSQASQWVNREENLRGREGREKAGRGVASK